MWLLQSALLIVEEKKKKRRRRTKRGGREKEEEKEGERRRRRRREKEGEKEEGERRRRGEVEREGERGSGRQKVCTVHSLSQRILHGTREQRKEMPDRDVCQLCPGGIEGERSLSTVRERGAHTTHSVCGGSSRCVSTGKFLGLIGI